MNNHSFGCDFGSYHLKIYHRDADSYLMQHNMVAVQDKNVLLACGDEAYAMYEKAPANIQVGAPMSYGNLASISNMQAFLKMLLESSTKGQLKGADYFVALPTDMQERNFTMLIQDSSMKPKTVYLVDKPVAAGLGLGINVREAQGVMIVDIGAETTEISVLSLGGIVISRLIQTGGRSIDDAIQSAIRKEYNFFIGSKTAESIKKELAYATSPEEASMQICGRNMVIGLPQMLEITSAFVYDAIKEQLGIIMDAVKTILERTPPELGVDIIRNGIYLTGGSARIRHLDQLLQEKSGIRVTVDEEPEMCVARGLAKVINEKEFRPLAFVTKEQKYD
ncbi:MAG: rod shape-determining protein [Eubacteriales bacterium]|nr:rod shape-determining protein [Eubacteriales bacterium]